LLVTALGGLSLFLWGVQLLSRELENSLGPRVENILYFLTSTPFRGFLTGLFSTFLLQSSSLTSVTMVGMVNARVIGLAQAIAVIIGSNVGTTVTGQLLSFDLHRFALPLFAAGFVLSLLPVKNVKEVGKCLRSFAVLLIGFSFMVEAFEPLKVEKLELVLKYRDNNFTMMGAGFLWASLLQSSSAIMGIAMAMLEKNVLPFASAVALTVGADVGTCITAVIASIKTSVTARKTAAAHFMFNLLSALMLLPFWNTFIYLAQISSPELTRQLANSHTIYNLLGALIFLPLIPLWVHLIDLVFPVNKN